jgi:hypothetical protein
MKIELFNIKGQTTILEVEEGANYISVDYYKEENKLLIMSWFGKPSHQSLESDKGFTTIYTL